MDESGKRCTGCGEIKPLSEFYKDKRAEDGYAWKCKLCSSIVRRTREEAKANPQDPVDHDISQLVETNVSRGKIRRNVDQYKCIQKHVLSSTGGWKGTTAKGVRNVWRQLLDYLDAGSSDLKGLNPDQIMDFQYSANSQLDERKKYIIFDQVQYFINSLDVCFNTAQTYGANLKSTFVKNRCAWPHDAKIKVTDKAFPIEGFLPIEEIKQACISLPIMYRAIILCRWQGSMDFMQFDYWNRNGYEKLIEDLDEGNNIIRIDFPARMKLSRQGKSRKKFHTYIGHDAIQALKIYLPTRKKVTGDQCIFYTYLLAPPSKNAIDRNWRRVMRGLGFMTPATKRDTPHGFMPKGVSKETTGKHLHELRDTYRTRWRLSRIPEQVLAEFFMGHTHAVDPNEYDKATRDLDWTLDIYEEVLPWLNIMSNEDPETIKRHKEEGRSEYQQQIEVLMKAMTRQAKEIEELKRRLD